MSNNRDPHLSEEELCAMPTEKFPKSSHGSPGIFCPAGIAAQD